jgi:hypothetical protein
MTKSTRARYTLEFKEEAVRSVTGGERVAPGILACRSRRCITGLALAVFRGDGVMFPSQNSDEGAEQGLVQQLYDINHSQLS